MTKTKPDLPWSIKGVDVEVRARAKDAAKRDGLTMGAWLSEAIKAGDDASPVGSIRAPVEPAEILMRLEALEARMVALSEPLQEVIAQFSNRLSQLEGRLLDINGPKAPRHINEDK